MCLLNTVTRPIEPNAYMHFCTETFLDPEGGSQKATLVVVVVLVLVIPVRSLKIPKALLIRSGAQRNFAYTFALIFPTCLLSQRYHCCDQHSFHVIDLKLDTEPSLNVQRRRSGHAALRLLQHGARWSVEMNIYAQAGLTLGL